MLIAQYGFTLLTVVCYGLLAHYLFGNHVLAEGKVAFRRTFRLVLIGWLLISGGLSYSGFFSDFSSVPPRFLILIIFPLLCFIIVFSSKRFKKYVKAIPPRHLIALQSFRIPVELLLWQLYLSKEIPVQMTFEECNFDVLTGLTAPIVAYLIYKNPVKYRKLAIVWNIAGLLLLLNIVSIAIISTPAINFFDGRMPNTAVAKFPIVYLPAFLVPMAYYLHFLSLRQLWKS